MEGLVKSSTGQAMRKTSVMLVQAFFNLFESWPENEELDTRQLRLKTICLMALTFMLRPSDIAPRAKYFEVESGLTRPIVFGTDSVVFSPKGGMSITFHRIKYDYDRDGFTVHMPEASESQRKCDPTVTLKAYMLRTESTRNDITDKPVFITLRPPFKAIDSRKVSTLLKESIQLAGLSTETFSAKCFRPTGATSAIDIGVNPDIVHHIGIWKSAETFEKHYVHPNVPASFVDKLLQHD